MGREEEGDKEEVLAISFSELKFQSAFLDSKNNYLFNVKNLYESYYLQLYLYSRFNTTNPKSKLNLKLDSQK